MSEDETNNNQLNLLPEKIQELTEKIKVCAFRHFNENGFAAVSMDMVAKELHISKKTIYKVFHRKEDILEKIIDEKLGEIEISFNTKLRENSKTEQLPLFAPHYHLFRNWGSAVLIQEIKETIPVLFEKIIAFRKRVFEDTFSILLQELKETEKADFDLPAEKLSAYFFNFLDTIPETDNPDAAATLILRGLKKKKPKKEKKKKKKK